MCFIDGDIGSGLSELLGVGKGIMVAVEAGVCCGWFGGGHGGIVFLSGRVLDMSWSMGWAWSWGLDWRAIVHSFL
jgi:hypothetical protein